MCDEDTAAVAVTNNEDDEERFIPLKGPIIQKVLLGRGRPLQKQPDNLRLRQLISNCLLEYE